MQQAVPTGDGKIGYFISNSNGECKRVQSLNTWIFFSGVEFVFNNATKSNSSHIYYHDQFNLLIY